MTTLIVVPCYNETGRFNKEPFLRYLRQTAQTSLLFVNDGSTDGTLGLLEALVGEMPGQIAVLHLAENVGKAEAVRLGFQQGLATGVSFIGFLDADLAAPIECMRELESLMVRDRKDIVMGARVALLGRRIERNNVRHYVGRVFATAASMILGLRVYDTQCGAKLFRVTDRLKSVFAAPFTVRWIFDVEILARFRVTESRGAPPVKDICAEYPLQEWIDVKGSKVGLKDFIISAVDLFRIVLILQKKALPGR